MRKLLITILILATLGVIGYFGYRLIQKRRQESTISSLQTVTASRGGLTSTIGATGVVRPEQTALLAWETTGNVDQVLVQVGDSVTDGQVLANLLESSLPQALILAKSDLITARDALAQLTNPSLSTISTAGKALSGAYTVFQQAQTDLANAIITNKNANDPAVYNDWFSTKTALDAARNEQPLVNASIDVQAYYQAVRLTQHLQDELDAVQDSAAVLPDDLLLAQKVADLQAAVQAALDDENRIQVSLPQEEVDLVVSLSGSLSAFESSTQEFIATVITDTAAASLDLAQVQAELTQRQLDLLNTQNLLTDLVNQRQHMGGTRCDEATIADYQEAYDQALAAYNFSGAVANSREYQLLQTASANLSWCTAVWSQDDIANQDAKIANTQAQVQLIQAQINSLQTQIANATSSVYILAIQLNTLWTTYLDASQQLSDAVNALYQLERLPDPDDLSAARARLQAAQKAVDSQSLVAPFSGTVTEVGIKPGDQVAPGSIALRLDNLDRLLVDVQVSEVDINSIRSGQSVILSFDAILDREYQGMVIQVAPVGNITQGVVEFKTTVELTNPDENVKPGMTAAVNIVVEQITDTLLVPNRAVRIVDGQRVVYILENAELKQVDVTLGASSDIESQVIAGELKPGDQIVLNPPQEFFGSPFGMGR